MHRPIGKISTALAALLLVANIGVARATGSQEGFSRQQEPPKDCKKDPNDPRCRDRK